MKQPFNHSGNTTRSILIRSQHKMKATLLKVPCFPDKLETRNVEVFTPKKKITRDFLSCPFRLIFIRLRFLGLWHVLQSSPTSSLRNITPSAFRKFEIPPRWNPWTVTTELHQYKRNCILENRKQKQTTRCYFFPSARVILFVIKATLHLLCVHISI